MSAPLVKVAAVALAAVAGGVVYTHMTAGGVSVAGPVCVTQTASAGNSVTVQAHIVNGTGSTAKVDLSTDPNIGPPAGPPYPAGGHPIPRSWIGLSGPYKVAAKSTTAAPVTIHVPANAKPGRYGTMIAATSYGTPGSGNGAAFGGGGGAWLELSVGVSPPPRAFCKNQRDTYWPPKAQAPPCKAKQVPVKGQNAVCAVLPLVPPVVSAKNCHMTRAQWDGYIRQLERAGQRYAHDPKAYLKDAHCFVGGHILNRAGYYASTGNYRIPDAPGQNGPAGNARTVTSG